MPELPEVEATVGGLDKKVKNKTIVKTWFDWPKFKAVKKTEGYQIKKVRRMGKNIIFYLNNEQVLLAHMKMTGHLLVGEWLIQGKKIIPKKPAALKEKVNGYIHFILILNNGQMIGFSDLRKFGKVIFGASQQVLNLPELKKLGQEAIATNYAADSRRQAISFLELKEKLSKKKKTIYQALLDQQVIAGLGNIYTNDVLWQARVSPFKLAYKLSEREVKRIYQAIKVILKKALRLGGTSVEDYRNVLGEKGGYSNYRRVYQREGQKCFHCRGVVKRRKQGGRSVFYCSHCQNC